MLKVSAVVVGVVGLSPRAAVGVVAAAVGTIVQSCSTIQDLYRRDIVVSINLAKIITWHCAST
jgi:hypothetical protein